MPRRLSISPSCTRGIGISSAACISSALRREREKAVILTLGVQERKFGRVLGTDSESECRLCHVRKVRQPHRVVEVRHTEPPRDLWRKHKAQPDEDVEGIRGQQGQVARRLARRHQIEDGLEMLGHAREEAAVARRAKRAEQRPRARDGALRNAVRQRNSRLGRPRRGFEARQRVRARVPTRRTERERVGTNDAAVHLLDAREKALDHLAYAAPAVARVILAFSPVTQKFAQAREERQGGIDGIAACARRTTRAVHTRCSGCRTAIDTPFLVCASRATEEAREHGEIDSAEFALGILRFHGRLRRRRPRTRRDQRKKGVAEGLAQRANKLAALDTLDAEAGVHAGHVFLHHHAEVPVEAVKVHRVPAAAHVHAHGQARVSVDARRRRMLRTPRDRVPPPGRVIRRVVVVIRRLAQPACKPRRLHRRRR
eukprot:Opistho-1_new@27707